MASEITKVATTAELGPGKMICKIVDGLPVVLANVEGQIYAFGDSCRHEGGPLSAGVLIGHTVTCPWHGWTYDIRTGKTIVPPLPLGVSTYPVHIDGDDIAIEITWS
jgi:nitrite reductase (NADH) small subunit/3-phenylpropionate/trans-cinnamate dioxygenase ferredoxin subunit